MHTAAGNMWRAGSDEKTFGRSCVENRQQQKTPSPIAKKSSIFFWFGSRGKDAAGNNLSPPRPRIHLIPSRPSTINTITGLARHEHVVYGIIVYRYEVRLANKSLTSRSC